MRFHVEIRRSFHVARAFNLDEQELRDQVLLPWSRGTRVELGGREWDPAEARLTILEGPALEPSQLAIGQGWHNAERSAADATGRLLAAARADRPGAVGRPVAADGVALLAQSAQAERAAAAALEPLGLRARDWSAVREELLAARSPRAAIVAFDLNAVQAGASARWWLDVGLALGALGDRAVLAALGPGPLPGELGAATAIRLDEDSSVASQALVERLRRAGCAIG